MSIWINAKERKPPYDEDVLILYKHKNDELKEENLFYGISHWFEDSNFHFQRWSYFCEYQGYYEVVYWTPLVDKPRIIEKNDDYE